MPRCSSVYYLLPFPVSPSQFWMSALATTIPVPCGAFMPVFVIGNKQKANDEGIKAQNMRLLLETLRLKCVI